MKFSCDQCNAQYMIADGKVGARGVKVKCKKCTHIIIVKPPTTEGVTRSDDGGQQTSDSHAGGGGFFGDGPFNEPTQAMSREQLKDLMASSASDSGLSESDAGMPPGDMGWPGSGQDTGVSPPADDWQGVPGADSFGRDSSSMFDEGAAAGFDSGSDMAGLDNDATQVGGGNVWPPAEASGDPTNLAALSSAGGGADVSSGEGDLNFDATLGRELSSTAAAPSRPPGEKEWYVAVDESQIGPVDIAEIEQRWDALDLDEDSLAWKAGMQDWSSIAEIPELAYLITERPQKRPSQQAAAGVSPSAGLSVSGGGSL
jgi:predicted Zn finger-like uncharacterized protein